MEFGTSDCVKKDLFCIKKNKKTVESNFDYFSFINLTFLLAEISALKSVIKYFDKHLIHFLNVVFYDHEWSTLKQ